VAAFSLSHVDDPVAALVEIRRVLHARGTVAVGVFAARHSNRPKDVVDVVAAEFGFEPPSWYVRFKGDVEPRTNTPDALFTCAERAGFE
jgi:ubiquinone/menaquinone biosynthesis C-methylase UbiE